MGTARSAWTLLAISLLGMSMAGCGGGDGDDTTLPVATTATVTKQEYIGQADAICTELQRKVAAVPDSENVSPQQALRLSEQFLAAVQPEFERLKALKSPPADGATVSQLNAHLDQIVVRLNEEIAAAQGRRGAAYDAAAEARATVTDQYNQLARQYGFKVCGR